MNAYADQCAPANPRMPMIDDMERLMRQAYYGNPEGRRMKKAAGKK